MSVIDELTLIDELSLQSPQTRSKKSLRSSLRPGSALDGLNTMHDAGLSASTVHLLQAGVGQDRCHYLEDRKAVR